MTETEVRAILGRPTSTVDSGSGAELFGQGKMRANPFGTVRTLQWKRGNNEIQCTFMNDKLWIKAGRFGNQVNVN